MKTNLLELDGTFGEGGGQILRSSLTLSMLTGRPFHLRHIRARRSKPGLQPQHLTSVRASAAISQAQVRGASISSTDLVFEPGPVTAGNYYFDIGTAGATGLVLQTLCLPLALGMSSPSELTLVGGTHVRASPCFHFLEVTWQSYMKLMSLTVSLQLIRPGFYPRGGGEVRVHIQPVTQLHGLSLLDRGSVAIHGFSAIARLPDHVAARQARRTVHRLKELGLRADLVEESWPGGPGSVLGLIVDMEPVPTLFFGLGERGKPAERVADEAVDQVAEFLSAAPAPVDPYSGDQVLLPLALAEGPSEYRVAAVTQHLLTNLAVVRKFVDREITCEEEEGRQGLVRIV